MPLPCVLFEDEHLLVVNKPAGLNTHAPAPFAGEGIYDWLRHREPRWATLAIIQRLDKETSGVMLFAKTPLANRSLTDQFAGRTVRKRYVLLTDRSLSSERLTAVSTIVRTGERYQARPLHAGAERAETHFRALGVSNGRNVIEAEPVTGKTHQIRVHAAAHGFPILGDVLYGGTPAPRVYLHAEQLNIRAPGTGELMTFAAPAQAEFEVDPGWRRRSSLIELDQTDAYRLIHGAADGWPGWYVDLFGRFLLAQSQEPFSAAQHRELEELVKRADTSVGPSFEGTDAGAPRAGAYRKTLLRQVGQVDRAEASPQWICGDQIPVDYTIRENGLRFAISFAEGYSIGLFLDQRDNRRRLLNRHVAAHFPLYASGGDVPQVLNLFAYTCGFSVCAAKAGAVTTSLDLSRKYLEWGQRNFRLNGLDPAAHDFIYGDAFDWMRRLVRKERQFEVVILDPPTFSRAHGRDFRAERDYPRLVTAALPLLKAEGVLFASTNAATLKPESFLDDIRSAIRSAGRSVRQEHFVPQPLDFPISRAEPAYLKTVWLRVA